MSVERHELIQEDCGAYVLGALTDEEHTRFARHLGECPVCRDEVDRLQWAVDALPRSVTALQAPPSLRKSVMAEVRGDLAEGASRPSAWSRLRERTAALGRMRAPAVSLSAAAVLALGVLLGFGVSHLVGSNSDSGAARTVQARFDRSRVADASGSLTIGSKDADAGGTLRVHGMPSLPSGQTYQVWLQRKGEMIPKALFSVGNDGNGLTAVDGDLNDAQAVLVTRERAGGARSPTGRPVLRVKL
jgi:anti-sigma-K factor RskA